MVFGSYCHVVSQTNLKKIRFRSPCEKITKPRFRKWNHWTDEIFSIINENILLNKVCSPNPLCLIGKIPASFGPKKIGLKLEKLGKNFCLKIGRIFFLLSKVCMRNKLYSIKNFHLLLKTFCPFSDFTFESEVLWFFSQGLRKRIFLRLVGENTWQ